MCNSAPVVFEFLLTDHEHLDVDSVKEKEGGLGPADADRNSSYKHILCVPRKHAEATFPI